MTPAPDNAPATQRLQVFLSHNGVCSRRDAMKIIQDGLVTVNGKLTTEPSTQVDPLKDRVEVQGRVVRKESEFSAGKISGIARAHGDLAVAQPGQDTGRSTNGCAQ